MSSSDFNAQTTIVVYKWQTRTPMMQLKQHNSKSATFHTVTQCNVALLIIHTRTKLRQTTLN